MRRVSLSIVLILATLVFFAPLAYSADTSTATTVSFVPTSVTAVDLVPQQVNIETSFVKVISDLMDSDVGYQLDESAAITLVYCPFVTEQSDIQFGQSASKIYVGLNFSF